MLSKFLRHFTKPHRKQLSPQVHACLPRDPSLEAYAKNLLEQYAPELAKQIVVRWNKRLRTTAGLACYRSSEVILHPALKNISEAEVDKTLRHELAHLLAHARSHKKRIAPHGVEWREACRDLGIPNEPRTHQLPFIRHRQQRRFFYLCPSCQAPLSRVRKPRRPIACLSCCRKYAGGKYDERFRYELTKEDLLNLPVLNR